MVSGWILAAVSSLESSVCSEGCCVISEEAELGLRGCLLDNVAKIIAMAQPKNCDKHVPLWKAFSKDAKADEGVLPTNPRSPIYQESSYPAGHTLWNVQFLVERALPYHVVVGKVVEEHKQRSSWLFGLKAVKDVLRESYELFFCATVFFEICLKPARSHGASLLPAFRRYDNANNESNGEVDFRRVDRFAFLFVWIGIMVDVRQAEESHVPGPVDWGEKWNQDRIGELI